MVNWVCALGLLMGAVFPSRDMVASMALSSATSGSMLVGVAVGVAVAVAVRRFGVSGGGAARLRFAFASAARRVSGAEVAAFGFVFAGAAATRVPPAAGAGCDDAAGGVLIAAEPADDGIAAGAAASGIAMIVAPGAGAAAALTAEAAVGGNVAVAAAVSVAVVGGGLAGAVTGAVPIRVTRSASSSTWLRWFHHDQPAPQAASNMMPASNRPNPRRAAVRGVGRRLESSASSMRIGSPLSVPGPPEAGMSSTKLGLPEAGCAIGGVS